MRFLPIILLASVLPCLPLFAGDEERPFLPLPESKAESDRALNAIIEKYNPDLSYKFKQDALNYPIVVISRSDYGLYYLVAKDAVYSTNKDIKYVDKQDDCIIVKDEPKITVLRCTHKLSQTYHDVTDDCVGENCPSADEICTILKQEGNKKTLECQKGVEYYFYEFINSCRSGKCNGITINYFSYKTTADYEKLNRKYYSSVSSNSMITYTHEEWLRYHAQDENNPNGYFTKRYKEEFNKDPMQQGE